MSVCDTLSRFVDLPRHVLLVLLCLAGDLWARPDCPCIEHVSLCHGLLALGFRQLLEVLRRVNLGAASFSVVQVLRIVDVVVPVATRLQDGFHLGCDFTRLVLRDSSLHEVRCHADCPLLRL